MDEYGQKYEQTVNPEPVSMKEWLITLLILMIPIVNLIMPFVWAFGGGSNPSKSNFFKAQIIVILIGIVLWFLFVGSLVGSMMNSYYL
ncbi:MAG TPA: hypothetical protein DDX29_10140 [Clostridiales bacterium]|nr:hypothetical protein [Clostridiales bacterium]